MAVVGTDFIESTAGSKRGEKRPEFWQCHYWKLITLGGFSKYDEEFTGGVRDPWQSSMLGGAGV